MMESGHIENVIVDAVKRRAGADATVTLGSALFDGGVDLDSVQFLELILEIETQVGVRLRDEDLTEEALASVGALVRHVQRLATERA